MCIARPSCSSRERIGAPTWLQFGLLLVACVLGCNKTVTAEPLVCFVHTRLVKVEAIVSAVLSHYSFRFGHWPLHFCRRVKGITEPFLPLWNNSYMRACLTTTVSPFDYLLQMDFPSLSNLENSTAAAQLGLRKSKKKKMSKFMPVV